MGAPLIQKYSFINWTRLKEEGHVALYWSKSVSPILSSKRFTPSRDGNGRVGRPLISLEYSAL